MPARTRRRFWIFFPAFTLACSVVVTFASGTVPADATVPGLIGRIAFAADIDGRTDIWVRDFVSNVPVNVTGNIDEERQPAWSPDGTKLAYASYGWLTGTGSIAVIDDTGGNFEILTDTAHDDWWPSWSRDGQTIVYTSTEDGPDQDIWVVDVDSKVRTNLTPDSSGDDYQPEWSPDGSHIVFVSDRSGSTDIWTMASGGAGPVNLTAAAASDWAPSWSPDGSQIAFVSDRDSALGDVHVMESDGTSVLRLTVNAEVLGRTAWSPDGTLIGFTSIKDGDLDVWMVAADGSSAPGHLTDHPANEFEVAWEPVSRPPVAVDDEFTVGVFDSLSGNLLDNDSDPDGDELTVVDISSAGEPGSFTYQADGSFTYTPPGFPEVCHSPNRTASAVYRIDDGRGKTDTAYIDVDVELPSGLRPPDGPQIGQPDFRISNMGPEGDVDYGPQEPVVIYQPNVNEYLVVWPADQQVDGDDEIWAQRLNAATGDRLGSRIQMTDYGAPGSGGQVVGWLAGAYGSVRGEYLVVWTAFGPDHMEIHGLRVDADGSGIEPGVFTISPTQPGGTLEYDFPAVAYNSTEDEYLVVWGGSLGGSDQVYGQLLTGTGQAIGPMFEVSIDNPGPGWIVQPDVAYNSVDNHYLVVWSGSPQGGVLAPFEHEIFARRFDPDGSPLDSVASRISDMGPDGDQLFDAQNASLVHNPVLNEYLVVWSGSDDATGFGYQHREIFGQLMTAGAMQKGTNDFRISEMNHVGWPHGQAAAPTVALDAVNNEYLVAWQGADATFPCEGYEVYGQRLSATGSELGADDFQVSHNDISPAWAEAQWPDVAHNPADGQYLVVWSGDYLSPAGPSPGEYEVHGQRLATNRAPVTEPDGFTVPEGGSVSGDVLDNDNDPEGSSLFALEEDEPAHGTVTLASDGSFTYEHDGSETTSDSFTYRASDGTAESAITLVTITVTPQNDPPVAEPDTFTVLEGGTVTGNVLDNDTDPEGIALSAIKETHPAHGTVFSWGPFGAFKYAHDGSETTSDSFTYRASDGLATSVATVTITVTPVNDPPVASDSTFTVERGGYLGGGLAGYDPEGNSVTFHTITDPLRGTLSVDPDGMFRYYHDGSASMVDEFSYQVSDGLFSSDVVTVTLIIGPAGHTTGLVDPATGEWHLRDVRGVWSSFYFGVPGDYPIMGDWDCDGIETPGLYRQSDGYAYLRNSNSTGVADLRFYFGIPGDIPLAGDFDGDGCDTVSIYRPSQGRVFISNQLGENEGAFVADFDYYFGNPGDKPFCGDFNGNGVETIGLHRESSGLVYFRQTHTQGFADDQFYYGNPGDRLISGDWGIVDGVFTMGIYRPSNQTTYLRYFNSLGIADLEYYHGEPDWLPIAGCTSDSCWLVK